MATVGDLGDIIHVIKKIINAIETLQKFKDACLEFKEYLWCISKNLEQLQGKPLSDTTVVTLNRLKDVLEKAYQVINSLQKYNFVYLMLNGTHILNQIKEADSRVHQYMTLFPIMQLNETFRLFPERTNIILREPHQSAPNRTDATSTSGCSIAQGVSLRIFKFKELRSATENFKYDHFIGTGLFGSVYKGSVKDNSGHGTLDVAIKRAHWNTSKEIEAEVKYLGRISHPNVIKLLGYCNKIDKRKWIGFRRKEANIYLSVSEYMANGSLSDHLFSGELSEKIDVHGFGATLLEILSGLHVVYLGSNLQRLMPQEFQSPEDSSTFQEFQNPVDSSTQIYRDSYLQKFIISSTSDLKNLDHLMDQRLEGKYPLKAARLAVQLTLNCVDGDPNKRPSMKEVIKVLRQIQTIKMPSITSAPSQIISDPCDPLPCDMEFLVYRSMVYEPAHFDADAELSFSVPRSMIMSEPAPFDAETELSFPKFKTSHSPINIEV